ncbi:hypothetical protein QYE76_057966 [Lolium multiflorum]|uniref:Uncharacterized protein n=1 Tax=Lolium multiflorum TaxID=4521 RepID=A0AAD8T4B3_LOLMU|nr:hypothetical protein QYE76_057966 [Lolium multiflorum]
MRGGLPHVGDYLHKPLVRASFSSLLPSRPTPPRRGFPAVWALDPCCESPLSAGSPSCRAAASPPPNAPSNPPTSAHEGRMSSGHLVCFKHILPLSGPALSWSHDQMWEVMQACVIMHNMIIEDDRKNHVRSHVGPYECQGPLAEVDHETADFADFLAMHAEIRDSNVHEQLQADLVEHLWRIKGNTVAP